MKLTILEHDILEIEDARLVYKNFAGEGGKYNREGDRNFCVVLPNREVADLLAANTNKYGVPWNVKVKPPIDEGGDEFIYLPVKIKFNSRGPKIYVKSGRAVNIFDESIAHEIDNMVIKSVDLNIRPYDDVVNGKPFRAAYLDGMWITQEVDRFYERFVNEEHPE